MREKCIATEYGSVYYWLSDTWNDEKETIFFFPGLTADHTLFESQVENMICVGQSFGGYHIQALIARYPEKVKAFDADCI